MINRFWDKVSGNSKALWRKSAIDIRGFYLCQNFSLDFEPMKTGSEPPHPSSSTRGLAGCSAHIKFNKYIRNESNSVFRGSSKANANKNPRHRDLENIKFILKGEYLVCKLGTCQNVFPTVYVIRNRMHVVGIRQFFSRSCVFLLSVRGCP